MGAYHPQVVHFAVALVFAGVGFRLLSLSRRLLFTNPAATTLILAGTVACFAATQTGEAAHGPVERIPGVRPAVVEHEEWAEWTRNTFMLVSAIEVIALALYARGHRTAYTAAIASAAIGAVGLGMMYETAEHGGAIVYQYAGGTGIRSGAAEDVNHLFVTGLYQQALQDRQSGRADDAMRLIELAATRFPANLDLQLLGAEWTTDVKRDPAAALQWLDRLQIAQTDTRARTRAGIARANALAAQGNAAGARGVLQTLASEFPNNGQIKRRLDELSGPAAKD
jgi:uncharacterized membrane protein